MDKGYETYCLSDPWFYESSVLVRDDDVDFELARGAPPAGWEQAELDDWLVYWPQGLQLPPQGWKIHASATLDNAEEVLQAVWDYCVANGISFKFIRSKQLLLIRNMKYAARSGSGKFVTIYPTDDGQFERILAELGEILDGQPGPYILSDLRYGNGPLYVRYGGFADQYCLDENGEQTLAIFDGDGRLVPDRRGPTFALPPWVTLPDFLEPHLAARNSANVQDLPYKIEEPLHFSNGGGLYLGTDTRSGEKVVLKEARPHAGLAADGADAVTRLHRERENLERLADTGVVPAVKDHFVLGDHHFVVLEYIDGTPLRSQLVDRYPLTQKETSEQAAAEYTEWVLETYERVERAVEAIHGRGLVIGDLHPFNVLVREDGRIVMIDWEVAWDVEQPGRQTLADPAFVAVGNLQGFDVDRYSMACLRLFMFMPLTMLLPLDPWKAEDLAASIAEEFPVPRDWLDEAVHVITSSNEIVKRRRDWTGARPPKLLPTADAWEGTRDSLAEAILSSATPDREDRLFPGDPKQFVVGGLNMAFGAAGVLYALAATGAGRHPEHEEWLVRLAMDPKPGVHLGFWDGLHGVAYALDRLDRRDDALRLLDLCNRELAGKYDHFGLDMFAGLAGIGLNLAHFAQATGDAALRDTAQEVAQALADRLGDEDSVPEISAGKHPYAGLIRGSSGPALLFLRLYEQSGDSSLLDLAATALRQDLRRCMTREEDGSLEVNEGWRSMPYLADGSVGIGLVLDEYLRHRDDERFAEASGRIRRAAESQFYIEPGLFWGRAGMILYLSQGRMPGTAAAEDPLVAAHIRRLDWHSLTYKGHLAFPGEQLLRLSMDFATGTAGVLLALGAALHDEPVHLPFLGPPTAEATNTERPHELAMEGR